MAERSERGRSVFVYRVGSGAGVQDVISVMEHEWVSKNGLPTEAILGMIRRPRGFGDDVSPDKFEENPGFVRFLHELISEHVIELGQVARGAIGQDGARIYLVDGRTTRQGGEVALQDVIGMVAVDDGRPVAGSYQPNPAHRLYTADGFFVLPPELESVLRREILARGGQS
ncbi:hypothetical protein [Micromonospora sp. NPDC005324]|uniref:hypothetical protein n=1 Tax=Micromonospora sp. NPDC005324 TaxID=3157033 RepID=UPI0033A9CF99